MVVAEATSTGNFSWPLSLSLTQDWCQIGRELELRDVRMLAILISYHKCNRCRWVGSGFKVKTATSSQPTFQCLLSMSIVVVGSGWVGLSWALLQEGRDSYRTSAPNGGGG